jgi:hypothetical protein
MNEKVIFIIGLLCCSCLSAVAQDDANKYRPLPNASLKQIQASGKPVTSVMPIFSQVVAFTLPGGFQAVFQNTQAAAYIFEAVLQGETVQQWSQMVTITGAKGLAANANASPQLFSAKLAGRFKAACPDTFSAKEIGATKISGHDAFVALTACGSVQYGGGDKHSETLLHVAVKGSDDYYTFQWAERGPVTNQPMNLDDAKWQDRLNKLGPIKICDRVPGEAAPYPSCLGQK